MSDCNHPKCDVCLRRSCRKYVGSLKQFGTVQACAACIHAAVLWAYTCACKWGGEAPRDFCGWKEEAKKVVDKAALGPIPEAAKVVAEQESWVAENFEQLYGNAKEKS